MKLELITPLKALNKAYLKEKVSRNNIELFKNNFKNLFSRINEEESEEHLKNVIADFLKDTWYKDQFEINTKDRNDLVIHSGKTSRENVGVIIEVKRPSNKSEMISKAKPNTKALQELILYYLRERLDKNNFDIKYLIVTNIFEWYVIDEVWFEKNVYRNTKLKREYENWKVGGKDTKFFYDAIAKSFLDEVSEEMICVHFNIRDFEKFVNNSNNLDDSKLINLYKIFSPVNLLKQPFANDSNSLDTKFYTELLHIIGLEEVKEGGKKLIKQKSNPDEASLLENTIIKLDDKDALRSVENLSTFGSSKKDQLFSVALELCITWVNRILFIKLLEAQLFRYHKANKDYLFLNSKVIFDFDELSNLFFQVLAESPIGRRPNIKNKFSRVPYLNSSLFERIDLERQAINVSELDNRLMLPLLNSTVLKDDKGKKRTGSLQTLQYLFEFLDSYDFTSEGGEEIQEENKNLINASVLGLIFEKINGYKDGSFFTPGVVTMEMCKESIRKAVFQKFREVKGWNCFTINNLYDKIDNKTEANEIINSIRICDPSVGSGHFLVSALNEIIAIKSELKILQDNTGKSLRDYHIEVINDELIVTDEDGRLFDYNPKNKESQRVQETLFHEKESIIENCLFGVDINPNSVKICQLRLWIELLKNAYYKSDSNSTDLETLPNIDINIKCGNSLISRFSLDSDIKSALRNNFSIDKYKNAVKTYKVANSKAEMREMDELIELIKKDFRSYISPNDSKYKRLAKLRGDLFNLSKTKELFDDGNKKSSDTKKKIEKLNKDILKISSSIDEIKTNKVYEDAFEWRFEFPEVIDEEGSFIGFDVIIANPPYVFGGNEGISIQSKDFFAQNYSSGKGKINLFTLFLEKGFNILKENGELSFIIPNTFLRVTSYNESRKLLLDNYTVSSIIDLGESVFEDAITTAIVISAQKTTVDANHMIHIKKEDLSNEINQSSLKNANYIIAINIDSHDREIIDTLLKDSIALGTISKEMIFGVVITMNKDEVVSNTPHKDWKPFLEGRDIGPYYIKPIHSYLNYDSRLLHRARTKEVFEVPEKILIQRITGGSQPLKAAYDNKGFYNKESINNIILNDDCGYSYKIILAILNSKLINWYYNKQFTNESKLTVNLSKEYLSQIPIPRVTLKKQKPFNQIVDFLLYLNNIANPQIIEHTSNDRIAAHLEEVLNMMIFELYFELHMKENEIDVLSFVDNKLISSSEIVDSEKILNFYYWLQTSDNPVRQRINLIDLKSSYLISRINSSTI